MAGGSVPGDHGQHVAQCHLWQLLLAVRKTSFPFCGHLLIFPQNKHCIHYLKQSEGLGEARANAACLNDTQCVYLGPPVSPY